MKLKFLCTTHSLLEFAFLGQSNMEDMLSISMSCSVIPLSRRNPMAKSEVQPATWLGRGSIFFEVLCAEFHAINTPALPCNLRESYKYCPQEEVFLKS